MDCEPNLSRFIYGFYRVPFDRVEDSMKMARAEGITKFDTAQLYQNEHVCADFSEAGEQLGTKIFHAADNKQFERRVGQSIRRFKRSNGEAVPIAYMLMHRPMPLECWDEMVRNCDRFEAIGVSNYDLMSLENLVEHSPKLHQGFFETERPRKRVIHQLEVHPFVDCNPVISYCQANQIHVQGHSILAQAKFFHFPPLQLLAAKYECSPATLLTAWALSKKIDVCISTSSREHLVELLQANHLQIQQSDVHEMDQWHAVAPHRFY